MRSDMSFTTRVFQNGNSKAIRILRVRDVKRNESRTERIDKTSWVERFFDEQSDDFSPEKNRTKSRILEL